MNTLDVFTQGDGVSRAVALLLLLMSVLSWIVIVWKAWLLRGGARGVLRAIEAFWQSPDLGAATARVRAFDRVQLVLPSVQALQGLRPGARAQSLGGECALVQQLTRALRGALHMALRRLHAGQILLATVGAVAPFVGLLGTVWGIHHALATISAQTGGFTIDKVAGPVGEALVMTAFGLAVAIPAVLAYNAFGRFITRIEAELEGFAHDLLAHFAPPVPVEPPPARAMPVKA